MLAGAGTGKTRVLTTRLAHLLQTGRCYPSQILSVTFTNKAAGEMKERVSRILGGTPVEGWWLGTFHALAARMLRRHADLVGLDRNFTIIDPDDANRLMKQIMEGQNLDVKKWPPKQVMGQIDRFKDKGQLPGDLSLNDAEGFADGRLIQLYTTYQARLKAINCCDFGDLLLHMIAILRDPAHRDVLADYHRRFKYIMVDEYQDTNVAQYLWLRLLARGSNNICCVGDDDQSIYGWRGAEVGNILRFEADFPGANIIRLEQNYRSTGHILAAASGVIAQNEGRLGKTLWSEADHGEKVVVHGLWDGPAEARWVGEEIEALQNKNWTLSQMAVLMRAGFQTREFEERFIQLGLPYRVIGGPRFYERQEIRDALAYLRVIASPADDLALERIINTPKRGIGDSTLQILYTFARQNGIGLYEATKTLSGLTPSIVIPGLPGDPEPPEPRPAPWAPAQGGGDNFGSLLKPKIKETLKQLITNFERWRSLIDTMRQGDLAAQMLDESGYMAMWQADKSPDASGRVENLKELASSMAEFESLRDFLEHVALVLENQQGNSNEAVTLMTLHGAKGLEFDAVFLPGWEEGLFPSQRSLDENGVKGLEEERRLAYVGLTRARQRAFVSHVGNRRMYGNWVSSIPSRFVDELPVDNIETSGGAGHLCRPLQPLGHQRHPCRLRLQPVRAAETREWNTDTSGASYRKTARADSIVPFQRGTRVSHDKFGFGTVINVEGHKLDIQFDAGGVKRVMDSFVGGGGITNKVVMPSPKFSS